MTIKQVRQFLDERNLTAVPKAKLISTHARALGGSKRESAQDILDKAKADGIKWRRSAMSPNGYVWIKVPPNTGSDARFIKILKALHLLAGTHWTPPKTEREGLKGRYLRGAAAENSLVCDLSVEELTDALIRKMRLLDGWELTFKQRADLMLLLLQGDA